MASARLKLFQLISPSLPVGAFTYSQGLEWAVEAKWVHDRESLQTWLESMLANSIATLELPMLRELYAAAECHDWPKFVDLTRDLIAWRETRELRLEEQQRGAALTRLLPSLGVEICEEARLAAQNTQLASLAICAVQWDIPFPELAEGYAWSWLENSVMAGVKLIPLGQTAGQQSLLALAQQIPKVLTLADQIEREDIASCTPAMAHASAKHETQYTRLFRS